MRTNNRTQQTPGGSGTKRGFAVRSPPLAGGLPPTVQDNRRQKAFKEAKMKVARFPTDIADFIKADLGKGR